MDPSRCPGDGAEPGTEGKSKKGELMKISTICIAKEKNDKSLTDLLNHEFSLLSLKNKDNLHVGLLYDHKKVPHIRTYSADMIYDLEEITSFGDRR